MSDEKDNQPLHVCYKLISEFYGDRTARRSGVRLMNHIDEGLVVLRVLDATIWTQAAYCLHPMVQEGPALVRFYDRLIIDRMFAAQLNAMVPAMALVMEYRRLANSYLSSSPFDYEQLAKTLMHMPLPEVKSMLIADKVQNRKDFEIYHKGKHPRSAELEQYFANWMQLLGISELEYARWCVKIGEAAKPQPPDDRYDEQ